MKNNKDKLNVLNFEINGDLSQYTDSLLFQDETIATLETELENDRYQVSIEVIGDIRLFFKGDLYKCSGNFPNELKEIINSGKVLEHNEIEIIDNNWFEIDIYEKNSQNVYELIYDEIFEQDISTMTPDELKEYMINHLKDYLKIENAVEVNDVSKSNENLDINI